MPTDEQQGPRLTAERERRHSIIRQRVAAGQDISAEAAADLLAEIAELRKPDLRTVLGFEAGLAHAAAEGRRAQGGIRLQGVELERGILREENERLLAELDALRAACEAAHAHLTALNGRDGDARTDEERALCERLREALGR
jgi:hypothetical protein